MNKISYLKYPLVLLLALVIALAIIKFEYGHNLWNRLCTKPESFTDTEVCKEVILKQPTQSENLLKQNYFYLNIQMPFIGVINDIKNPTLGSSITISQYIYALKSPQFYIAFMFILCLISLAYILIKNFLKSFIMKTAHVWAFLIHDANADISYDDLVDHDMLQINVFMAQEGQYDDERILVVWTDKEEVTVGQVLEIFMKNGLKVTYLPNWKQP